jgi:hypothetical protein
LTGYSTGEEIMQIQARSKADVVFVMAADGELDARRIGVARNDHSPSG